MKGLCVFILGILIASPNVYAQNINESDNQIMVLSNQIQVLQSQLNEMKNYYDTQIVLMQDQIDELEQERTITVGQQPPMASPMGARVMEFPDISVVGNIIGTDGNDKVYNGYTSVIDPVGDILFQQADTACIHTSTLSSAFLQDYRQAFPAWMDRDKELDNIFL